MRCEWKVRPDEGDVRCFTLARFEGFAVGLGRGAWREPGLKGLVVRLSSRCAPAPAGSPPEIYDWLGAGYPCACEMTAGLVEPDPGGPVARVSVENRCLPCMAAATRREARDRPVAMRGA